MERTFDSMLEIEVIVHGTTSPPFTFEVDPTTTGFYVCNKIMRSANLASADAMYYSLILVHSGETSEAGKGPYHCLRTVGHTESIRDVLELIVDRQREKYGPEYMERGRVRWFFKDYRSLPLDLDDGDVSGPSSDEEEDYSLNDLAYVRQGERRGFMLRKSARDPNLWRRRYCVLTDKLWSINLQRKTPRALSVNLSGNIALADKYGPFEYPYAVVISVGNSALCFKASSSSEQQSWITEITNRMILCRENDCMMMAEVIICDEESAAIQRFQKAESALLDTALMKAAVSLEDACPLSTPSQIAVSLASGGGKPEHSLVHSTQYFSDEELSEEEQTDASDETYRKMRDSVAELKGNLGASMCTLTLTDVHADNAEPTEGPHVGVDSTNANALDSQADSAKDVEVRGAEASKETADSKGSESVLPATRSYDSLALAAQAANKSRRPRPKTSSRRTKGSPSPARSRSRRGLTVVEGFVQDGMVQDGYSVPDNYHIDGVWNTAGPYQKDTEKSLRKRVHKSRSHRLIHNMHKRNPSLSEALSFFNAVQRYREMHRHDVTTSPKELWVAAMAIYKTYLLAKYNRLIGNAGRDRGSRGSRRRSDADSVIADSEAFASEDEGEIFRTVASIQSNRKSKKVNLDDASLGSKRSIRESMVKDEGDYRENDGDNQHHLDASERDSDIRKDGTGNQIDKGEDPGMNGDTGIPEYVSTVAPSLPREVSDLSVASGLTEQTSSTKTETITTSQQSSPDKLGDEVSSRNGEKHDHANAVQLADSTNGNAREQTGESTEMSREQTQDPRSREKNVAFETNQDDTKREDGSGDGEEAEDDDEEEYADDLVWNIPIESLSKVHQAVFVNVRRRLIAEANGNADESQEVPQGANGSRRMSSGSSMSRGNTGNKTAYGSFSSPSKEKASQYNSNAGFWLWGSSNNQLKDSNDARNGGTAARPESSTFASMFGFGARAASKEEDPGQSPFKLVDHEVRPRLDVFDEVVGHIVGLFKKHGVTLQKARRRRRRHERDIARMEVEYHRKMQEKAVTQTANDADHQNGNMRPSESRQRNSRRSYTKSLRVRPTTAQEDMTTSMGSSQNTYESSERPLSRMQRSSTTVDPTVARVNMKLGFADETHRLRMAVEAAEKEARADVLDGNDVRIDDVHLIDVRDKSGIEDGSESGTKEKVVDDKADRDDVPDTQGEVGENSTDSTKAKNGLLDDVGCGHGGLISAAKEG